MTRSIHGISFQFLSTLASFKKYLNIINPSKLVHYALAQHIALLCSVSAVTLFFTINLLWSKYWTKHNKYFWNFIRIRTRQQFKINNRHNIDSLQSCIQSPTQDCCFSTSQSWSNASTLSLNRSVSVWITKTQTSSHTQYLFLTSCLQSSKLMQNCTYGCKKITSGQSSLT